MLFAMAYLRTMNFLLDVFEYALLSPNSQTIVTPKHLDLLHYEIHAH